MEGPNTSWVPFRLVSTLQLACSVGFDLTLTQKEMEHSRVAKTIRLIFSLHEVNWLPADYSYHIATVPAISELYLNNFDPVQPRRSHPPDLKSLLISSLDAIQTISNPVFVLWIAHMSATCLWTPNTWVSILAVPSSSSPESTSRLSEAEEWVLFFLPLLCPRLIF